MPGLLVVVNPPASADGREAFEKGVRALYRRAWHRTVYDTGDAATWYRAVVVEDPEVDVVRVDAERPNGRRFGVFDVAVQPGLFDGEPEVGGYLRVALDDRASSFRIEGDLWGQYRLYYRRFGDAIVITSDPSCVLRFRAPDRTADSQVWMRNAAVGGVLGDAALVAPWKMLPPRAALSGRADGSLETLERAPAWRSERSRGEDEAAAFDPRMVESMRRASQRITQSHPGQLGVSLTGGVDSRLAAAGLWAEGETPACYCFGSEFGRTRDERVAQALARDSGAALHVVRLDAAFRGRFWELAQECVSATGGLLDVSGAAEIYANEIARQWGAVRVTGNYGGELFRNLVAMGPTGLSGRGFVPEMRRTLDDAVAEFHALERGDAARFIAEIQMPVGHYARRVAERSQLLAVSPFVSLSAVDAHRALGAPSCDRAAFLEWAHALYPGTPLVPIDRHDIHQSASQRMRLSSRWLDKLTFKLEYYFDYGMPDAVATGLATLRLWSIDRWFLGRHKFYHFNRWYREELRAMVSEILLDPQFLGRSEIDADAVERVVAEHLSGRRNRCLDIHALLGFAAFHGF